MTQDIPTLEQLFAQSERIRGRELTNVDLDAISPEQAAAERRLQDYHNKVDMVRSFKGCPASIILGLHVTGRPHNNTELKELTSYSYESIKPALSFLERKGYIKRTEGKWQLCKSIY